jgi:dihydrofolate reductase
MIAAVADNGVIGDGDGLLWHISADLVRFKRLTMGGVIIMGRKTYASIGRPLPGRVSVVLTRRRGLNAEDLPGLSADRINPSADLNKQSVPFPAPVAGSTVASGTADQPATMGPILVHDPDELAEVLDRWPERARWVIGGGEIYRLLWDQADRLEITEIHQSPNGSVLFPPIDPAQWVETSREPGNGWDFVSYRRRE